MLGVGLFMVGSKADPQVNSTKPKFVKPANEIWVMVIDTGIGVHSKLPNVQYRDSDNYVDTVGHGTHVAGIITYGSDVKRDGVWNFDDQICPQVKIFGCKYFGPNIKDNLAQSIACVKRATEFKMDYINYSAGGPQFSEEEYKAYKDFAAIGGTAVVAAGNEKQDLTEHPYYPASYSFEDGFSLKQKQVLDSKGNHKYFPIRMYAVENVDLKGNISVTSNHHSLAFRAVGEDVMSTLPNNRFGLMTGTSQAAPSVLHLILRQRCKELNAQK